MDDYVTDPQTNHALYEMSMNGNVPQKRGLHNWRNLFKKPTFQDWIIMFMLIMVVLMGYAYKSETEQCRAVLQNLPVIACDYCNQLTRNFTDTTLNILDIPYINQTGDLNENRSKE
jgi:hypothetical protein